MTALSQIVGNDASLFDHSLCVASRLATWQIVGVDSDDKNGGPNNLRAWRLSKGWSQAELAERVVPKTNANMIQYLESGERGLSLKWLRRLADALETTPGHLADHLPEQAEMLNFWSKKLDREEMRQLSRIVDVISKTGTNE